MFSFRIRDLSVFQFPALGIPARTENSMSLDIGFEVA
jgi:hypothetical protein